MTVTLLNDQGEILDSAGRVLQEGDLVVVGIQSSPGTIQLGRFTGRTTSKLYDDTRWVKPWTETKFEIEWVWGSGYPIKKPTTLITVGSNAAVLVITGVPHDGLADTEQEV